jgi:hypothetical protein
LVGGSARYSVKHFRTTTASRLGLKASARTTTTLDAGASERRNFDEHQDQEEATQEHDVVATQPILSPQLQSFVDAIRVHAPNMSEAEIVPFLLHTARGRSVAEHLANITKSRKEQPPMSRFEKLQQLAKRGGVQLVAKALLAKGDAMEISEFEFFKLMESEAERRGMTFEKYFCDPTNVDIRKAHQLTKATLVDVQPVTVETGSTATESDAQAAYEALEAKAEELRRSAPYLSTQQAFARAFEAEPE